MAFGVSQDMDLTPPKVTPQAVVKQVLSAIETGLDEVLGTFPKIEARASASLFFKSADDLLGRAYLFYFLD